MSADERLDPKRRLVIAVIALTMATAGFAAGRTALRPTERAALSWRRPAGMRVLQRWRDAEQERNASAEDTPDGRPPYASSQSPREPQNPTDQFGLALAEPPGLL